MAKSGATRQKEYRQKIKALDKPDAFKKAMIAAYMLGFTDSATGKEPRNNLNASDLSISYLCGGLDEIMGH